ncbi:hypothetical protein [Pseudomonas putida]|uniref:hypothetical protein n=1 Tax=Pseudomonas putida TaxID=303 RepID=UPI0007507EE0|nr:hypothetical protein [Pseudomonas putida]
MSDKVIYEPHPVSAERKAELRREGYKIIDASFAPGAYKASMESKEDLRSRKALDAALDKLPGDQSDPDYVVGSMRSFYGELFTQEDESRVRELVKAPIKKPSHGLRIDDIKAKLNEKGIAFSPDAERSDLAKLLDEAV